MAAPVSIPGLHVRELLALEAGAHRWPGREVRPVAGGILVHDPEDPEPVFNRLIDPIPPDRAEDWPGWLDGIEGMFGMIDRRPHLWVVDEPEGSSIPRLERAAYRRVGTSRYMALADPGPCRAVGASPPGDGVSVERVVRPTGGAWRLAGDIAFVIGEAFELEPALRILIEADVRRMLEVPAIGFVLARRDGEPVAVARRTTDGDGTLLAAVGTRREHRRGGLGRLVTAVAVLDALEAGSRIVYLGVEDDNLAAQAMYAGLGFAFAAGRVVDLLHA